VEMRHKAMHIKLKEATNNGLYKHVAIVG
jgi:hypothetical protein